MDAVFAGRLLTTVGRIACHVAYERVRPPAVRVPGDVPRSPDDINAPWLTALLRSRDRSVRIEHVESFGGSSGTTTRRHLRVRYAAGGEGLPTDLYAKTTTRLTERLLLGLTGIIEVEGLTYERVMPLLDIEAPQGIASGFDARSWRSVCITSDVASLRGAQFCSPQTELTLEQVKDLLAAMATWHGTMWRHPILDEGWLQSTAERQAKLSDFLDWGKRSAVGFKRAGSEVPPFALQRHDDAVRAFERSMALGSEGPHTFLHGDPHAGGNYYTTADGRMGWADWGVCLRGSWAYDYAYFVVASLPTERRRAWERQLLAHYLEQLEGAGGEAPEFDDAWLAYTQQTIYPMVAWAAVYGHGPLQPDSQPPEFCVPIISRAAHAVQDLGAIDAVLQPRTRSKRSQPA